MNIKVLFFGRVRETIKSSAEDLVVPNNSTLKTVINMIESEFAAISELPIIYSINNEYIYDLDTSLKEGDIIGFIPPISGG